MRLKVLPPCVCTTMDLAELLGEEYLITFQGACLPAESVGHHMVRYIQTEYFTRQKNLPADFVAELLRQAIRIESLLPNVVQVSRKFDESSSSYSGRVTVIGDLHGQYRDLEYLFSPDGPISFPTPDNQVIVNGNMISRGDMSVETVLLLSLFAVLIPGSVHLLRGNHEVSVTLRAHFGFETELAEKFPCNMILQSLFVELFQALPVAAVVDQAAFVVHSGLGICTSNMAAGIINRGNRFAVPIPHTPLHELLWNYPRRRNPPLSADTPRQETKSGDFFGKAFTEKFLKKNKFDVLIRSHEFCVRGYDTDHDHLCVTVFSAANCSGKFHNTGAVVQFDQPKSTIHSIVQFKGHHYPIVTSEPEPKTNIKVELKGYDGKFDYELQQALQLSITEK